MLGAVVSLFTGYLEAKVIGRAVTAAENWGYGFYCLLMSLFITSFVSFFGTWGATTTALMLKGQNTWFALVFGFASALFVTAAIVYRMWTANPLTRGITVAVPSAFAAEATEQSVTSTVRN